MPKRRARANRIGASGEAAFASLATDVGLLPTKAQEDVGIDFICQIDADPTSFGSSEVTGGLVGFAVRATEARDKRIRLSRDDAEILLRMNAPVGVILIAGRRGERTFHHRMVDEAFSKMLLAFLDSDRLTLSLTPAQCRDISELRSDVLAALRPGEVERRRVAVAESRLAERLEGVQIDITRNAEGSLTLVSKFRFWDMFGDLDEDQRELLLLTTFGAPELLEERLAALPVPDHLVSELEGLPTPYLLGGEVEFRESELRATGPNGDASCRFRYTRGRGHYGHVHEAGFAVTVSDRQQHEGRWVHHLRAIADPDVALDLADHPDLWNFLASTVASATISDVDRPEWRFGAGAFEGLPAIGRLAACMREARSLPGWSSRIAQLRDAEDEETSKTLRLLSAAGEDISTLPSVGFETRYSGSGFEPQPGRWRVPVLANTRRTGVLVWLTCVGDVLVRDERIVGVDTHEYLSAEIEVRDERFAKATIHPEFVFQPDYPTIAIGDTTLEAVSAIDGRGPEGFEAMYAD